MPVPRAHLEVLADLVAGAAGHDGVRQHHVGIDVVQPDQRGIGVADGDDFVAFVAEDALAHALGVRAVVHQQDAAHFVCGLGRRRGCGCRLQLVDGLLARLRRGSDRSSERNGRAATIRLAISLLMPGSFAISASVARVQIDARARDGRWARSAAPDVRRRRRGSVPRLRLRRAHPGCCSARSDRPRSARATSVTPVRRRPPRSPGTLAGIVGRKPGHRRGARFRRRASYPGAALNGPQTWLMRPRLVRFSISYFMRA